MAESVMRMDAPAGAVVTHQTNARTAAARAVVADGGAEYLLDVLRVQAREPDVAELHSAAAVRASVGTKSG